MILTETLINLQTDLNKCVLVMDILTRQIQDEVSCCMLFADDTVLIDETRNGVNVELEVRR